MIRFVATLLLVTLPPSALGHHPMGGETPQTLAQGLLSGLGHPIIELDHFLFVIGFAGLLGLTSRRALGPMGLFLVLTMAGSVICVRGANLPLVEAGVLISSLILGLALIIQRLERPHLNWFLASIAGLCHGYAYGEAVIGAETTPILSYLVGFTLIQAIIMAFIIIGVRRLTGRLSITRHNQVRVLAGTTILPLAFLL